MSAVAWTFAAIVFVLWLVEHYGGADARDRLRKQRDEQTNRADDLALKLLIAETERDVARRQVHPSARHLRVVRGDES